MPIFSRNVCLMMAALLAFNADRAFAGNSSTTFRVTCHVLDHAIISVQADMDLRLKDVGAEATSSITVTTTNGTPYMISIDTAGETLSKMNWLMESRRGNKTVGFSNSRTEFTSYKKGTAESVKNIVASELGDGSAQDYSLKGDIIFDKVVSSTLIDMEENVIVLVAW